MKLAMTTSKERDDPPSFSWMQCKLFDLLTLTERAIEKRRRHFLESYSVKAIEYCNEEHNNRNIFIANALNADITAKEIVSKYFDLVAPPGFEDNNDFHGDQFSDFDIEDISLTSNDLNDFAEYGHEYSDVNSDHVKIEEIENDLAQAPTEEVVNRTIIKQSSDICDDNLDLVPCPKPDSDCNYNESKDSYCELPIETSNDTYSHVSKLVETNFNKIIKPEKVLNHPSTRTKIIKRVSSKELNLQNKTKRKKSRDHRKLQSTLSKPIPNSLIELCHPEHHDVMKSEGSLNNLLSDNDNKLEDAQDLYEVKDVAMTENSVFIAIVTEFGEETVALRRNVAINPEMDFEIIDQETALETVINITKDDDDDFFIDKNVDIENVTSQTIFIYDINQPSTSKGFQHLNADVQCGPDNSLTCATISATTSLTAVSKICSNNDKIKSSPTKVRTSTNEFGTCTDTIENIPKAVIGIKIKDSENDFNTMAKYSSVTTQVSSDDLTLMNNGLNLCQKDTKLLKPLCTLINEDSGSGLCSSTINLQKSISHFHILSKNNSDIQILSLAKDENITIKRPQRRVKQNLIYGGIHVHSFRDKFVSEDVVYQGDWQRTRSLQRKRSPDISTRRSNSPSNRRKFSAIVQTHIMNTVKKVDDGKKHEKISLKTKTRKIKLCNSNKTFKKLNNVNKDIITEKTRRKKPDVMATPIVMSSTRQTKNTKSYYRHKLIIESDHISQKEEEPKNTTKKNYLPTYLKRRINQSSKTNNNIEDKTRHYSMVEEIPKDLLKITENVRNRNKYLIYRNETETRASPDKKLVSIVPEIVNHENSNSANRNVSPPSQNSSACSSPNSVATVRSAFTRNRIIPNRRDSPSSERSSSGFENEVKSRIRGKNYSKRYKSHKMSPNRTTLVGNKENVPESSKNIKTNKYDIPKDSKSTFAGKTTGAFILQTNRENIKLQTARKICLKNYLEKPVSIINDKNNEENLRLPSELNNIPNHYSYSGEKQHGCVFKSLSPPACTNYATLNSIKDTVSQNDNTNIQSDIKIHSPKNSVHRTKSSIMSAIRQLIEENIHISENNSHDSLISGSETVILNNSDIYNSSMNESSSPVSIETVIAVEDSQDSNTEDCFVNLSSPDENKSLLSSDNIEPQITELDTISFKSSDLLSVSDSKFSEYYLADNELDNFALPQMDTLNISSVQELFERKDRHNITNIKGSAVQAFSGFSINAGSFVGDRPDSINVIDSETGSLTFDSARQAASEEVFVSGRSSDTYESCFFDDDTYVPSWLFNVISRQQSINESENEDSIPTMPLEEPLLDVNGNIREPEEVAVGAGAGDGRGMHSDRSQDSSGRGSSLSSSATSSGQNEAILIDLSAITSHQTDNIHGTVTNHGATVNDESHQLNRSIEGNFVHDLDASAGVYSAHLTSDIDADVSSFDTDAVDSDN